MNLQDAAAYAGIVGGFAAVASVYYAWRNDKFLGLVPRNEELEKAFPKDENAAAFSGQVHETLKRVTTHRQLRQALVIARESHLLTNGFRVALTWIKKNTFGTIGDRPRFQSLQERR